MKTIKLNEAQLRKLIQNLMSESPIPGQHHPLASDDNGISPVASALVQQLAMQVAEDMSEANGDDDAMDSIYPELQAALVECITGFFSGFAMGEELSRGKKPVISELARKLNELDAGSHLGTYLEQGVTKVWEADNIFKKALEEAPNDDIWNAINALHKALERLAFDADGKMKRIVGQA